MADFKKIMNSDILYQMKALNFKNDIIQKFKGWYFSIPYNICKNECDTTVY